MFSKLSNELFYRKDNVGYMKIINNDKLILVNDYFYQIKDINNICRFSIEDIITAYGFTPRREINGINKQILDIILKMNELQLIEFIGSINDIDKNIKYMFKCKLNIDTSNNFFILDDEEKNLILQYKKSKVDNIKVLILYCYLKSRMYTRDGDYLNDVSINGGRSECCYPAYETIYNDIGISQGTIKKYIDILNELDLIRYGNAGLWYYKADANKKHKGIYESANTYVLFKDGWENELKEGIKAFKSSDDKVFINRSELNDRKINGKKGSIIRKINNGVATEKDINELDKINEIIDNRGEARKKNMLKDNIRCG